MLMIVKTFSGGDRIGYGSAEDGVVFSFSFSLLFYVFQPQPVKVYKGDDDKYTREDCNE